MNFSKLLDFAEG